MKVKIGGHDYVITEIEGQTTVDGHHILGRESLTHNTIHLEKQQALSRKKETLLHEILHAMLGNVGEEQNEKWINTLANGLHQMGVSEYVWKLAKKGKDG